MGLIPFLLLLLIAGICGSIGAKLGGQGGAGCLGSVALGFIGAVLGLWLARELSLPPLLDAHIGGVTFPVVWSVMGAALFVALLGVLRGRSD